MLAVIAPLAILIYEPYVKSMLINGMISTSYNVANDNLFLYTH